ncbi:MAG: DNA topoisomerase [Segetibacter sp.]
MKHYFHANDINGKPVVFKAEGPGKIAQQEAAEKFLDSCKGAKYTVTDVSVRPAKRTPAAPFTTSTLQQEASRKLGYSVSKTMLLAQKLIRKREDNLYAYRQHKPERNGHA